MPISPGSRIGPYQVTALLGEGGMGKVWRAHHAGLKRDDALKVLPEGFSADPERLARFQREAQVLASLNHPNIAHVYGLEQADGQKALVMELVEGPTLADRIAQGPIPVDEALPIAKQIAEALEAAHEQGIIHRDLKPANVKVRPDGTVKVLDFGLAKAMEPAANTSSSMSQSPTITTPAMTQAGMILGTAAYMSPEQARGKPVDKRTDIWAFGCVLYEMLTGRRAFEGEDVSVTLADVIRADPPWEALPDNLTPSLPVYLKRCMEKDPARRVQAMGDVRLALEGAFETAAPHAEATVVTQSGWTRSLRVATLAAAGTLALAALVAWSLWPAAEPATVTRFAHDLPADHTFPWAGRNVLALSPDGRQFVYTTAEGLYLRSMDAVEARLIPGTESRTLGTPFYSPDGQSVGFFDAATNQLKRIATSGGVPLTVCATDFPFGASWASDDTILFGHFQGIMRVSANGGVPELVVPAANGEQMDGPQLLPDGEHVLFTVTASTGAGRWDQAQIVAHSLRTGERTVLWQGGSDARYVPTGHLTYALRDVLYAVAFDIESLTVSGTPVPIAQGVQRALAPETNGGTANFGISDQASLVYLRGTFSSSERVLAIVNSSGLVEPLPIPPAEYLNPRVSPDGQRVVVQTREEQGNILWVYQLGGVGQIQQLTFDGDNQRPIWTPDGQRITFASDRDGTMSLYWMPADGSGAPERLSTAEDGTSHWPQSWSPDGRTLLFNVQRALQTDWDIWVLSMSERETRSLYDTPGTIYLGAELSPDGRWLAYGAGPVSTTVDIYVEPFPATGARRRISQSGGYWPLWSRDQRRMFYRPVAVQGAITLKSVDLVTEPAFAFSNEQTLPIEGFSVVAYYRDYDITPEGERLLMVFPASRATGGAPARPQIRIVQNLFTELERLVPTR